MRHSDINTKLTEAREDYRAMIEPVLAAIIPPKEPNGPAVNLADRAREKITTEWKEQISSARSVLKTADRIIWYLRFARQMIIRKWVQSLDPIKVTKLKRDFDAKSETNYDADLFFNGTLTKLEHFFSLPIRGIAQYRFRNQSTHMVMHDLTAMEDEWKQTLSRMFVDNECKIIIDFKNDWCWVTTDKASCSKEAAAMGHCGNSPRSDSDDTLLSLRKHTVIDGDNYWEPHLTFILNRSGELTEMKGRGNEKPVERYHQMIVALLLNPMIKGIVGGGYLPENNFSLSDLSDEDRETVLEQKPELGSSYDLLSANGFKINHGIMKKLHIEIENLGNNIADDISFEDDGEQMVVKEFGKIDEFIRNFSGHDFGDALSQLNDASDGFFDSIAEWMDEKDAMKGIVKMMDEDQWSEEEQEILKNFRSRLAAKLGVSHDDVVDGLFHLFPKSVDAIYGNFVKDFEKDARRVRDSFIANIRWECELVRLVIEDDYYKLIVDTQQVIEAIHSYHSSDDYDYIIGGVIHYSWDGWNDELDPETAEMDQVVPNLYSKALTNLTEEILDLFETNDQLSFDF